MSIGYPVMALGVETPNPTFSLAAAVPSQALGWSAAAPTGTGTMTQAEVFEAGTSYAHARHQKYTLGGTGASTCTITNGASTPYKFTANVSSLLTVFCTYRASGLTDTTNVVILQVRWYNASGTALGGSASVLKTLGTADNSATWATIQNTITVTPPATAQHFKLSILFSRGANNTAQVLEVRFLAVGTWIASAGYMDWNTGYPGYSGTWVARYPTLGHQSVSTGALDGRRDTVGRFHPHERSRSMRPNRLTLPVMACPEVLRSELWYAWQMNRGVAASTAAINPNGGHWPIIVLPKSPSCVHAMLANFAGEEFPLGIDPSAGWMADTPATLYGGTLTLEEIV